MQNLDKVNPSTPETYLNVGDGFNLLVGGTFKLIVGALGLGGMTNFMKASIGTTWSTWTTAWDDETKTWDELLQLLENDTKTITSITNNPKP